MRYVVKLLFVYTFSSIYLGSLLCLPCFLALAKVLPTFQGILEAPGPQIRVLYWPWIITKSCWDINYTILGECALWNLSKRVSESLALSVSMLHWQSCSCNSLCTILAWHAWFWRCEWSRLFSTFNWTITHFHLVDFIYLMSQHFGYDFRSKENTEIAYEWV